ncbi:MAG: hypothetical protein P8Y70_10410 [Candidatus Lokiarchaeota archaeon]
MSNNTEEVFINRLYEVLYKLSNIANTQSSRFNQKWIQTLKGVEVTPHLVRQFKINKEKFINNIDYRIECLKTANQAVIDGFYAIKTLLDALYNNYFKSKEFTENYSKQDRLFIKYLVAKEILGNLIQYNKMDHETVPLRYNIMARNYTTIKLVGQKDTEILENMNKIFHKKPLELDKVREIMELIANEGLIDIEEKNQGYLYKLKKEIELSENGNKKFEENLLPLVMWPTQFWRSFYNIRELNMTPNSEVKYSEFLTKVLSRAATQGFAPMDYVLKNLVKYFKKIKEG